MVGVVVCATPPPQQDEAWHPKINIIQWGDLYALIGIKVSWVLMAKLDLSDYLFSWVCFHLLCWLTPQLKIKRTWNLPWGSIPAIWNSTGRRHLFSPPRGSFVIAVATTPLDPTNMGIKRQEQEDKHDRRSIRWGDQKDRGVFFGKNARLTS